MTSSRDTPTALKTPSEQRDAFLSERHRLLREDLYLFKLPTGPKLVVHLASTEDQWPTMSRTAVKRIPEQGIVPLLPDVRGGSARMTFDGRAFYLDSGDGVYAVTHLLHNGVVEAVMSLVIEHAPPHFKGLSLRYAEECALRFVRDAVNNGLAERTTRFPMMVRIALIDCNTCHASRDGDTSPRFPASPVVRQLMPVLVLPDVVIKDDEQVVEQLLPAALERMWHAWGFNGSPTFKDDDAGLWHKVL